MQVQVVDCTDASAQECHKAEHAANAFDTEKLALMHGLFKMLQAPPGQLLRHTLFKHLRTFYASPAPLSMHV